MSRERLLSISRAVFTLAWLNMFAFCGASLLIGGAADRAEDGRYFLSSHGVETEVSRGVYLYSRVHEITFIASWPLAVLGLLGWAIAGEPGPLEKHRDPDYLRGLEESLAGPDPAATVPMPPGTWFQRSPDGFVVGATNRDVTMALVLAAPLVLMLGLFAAGLAQSFSEDGRDFPGPSFNPWLAALILIPLCLLTLVLTWAVLQFLAGKVVISGRGGAGQYFAGIGPIGRRVRFDWAGVAQVREAYKWWTRCYVLELVPVGERSKTKTLSGAATLSDRRRHALLLVLESLLATARNAPRDGRP